MPHSSTRYFIRARLRFSRLPKSRWTVTMASTGGDERVRCDETKRFGEARKGRVVGVAHTHAAADQEVVAT